MNQFNLSIIIAIKSSQYAYEPIIFDGSLNINSHPAIILVNNYNLLLPINYHNQSITAGLK